MDHEMDRYVGRSLKNWTARQPLPANGREALLKAAAAAPPAVWQEQSYFRSNTAPREFANNRMMGFYTGEWLRSSFTVSLSWPTQMGTLVQFS